MDEDGNKADGIDEDRKGADEAEGTAAVSGVDSRDDDKKGLSPVSSSSPDRFTPESMDWGKG